MIGDDLYKRGYGQPLLKCVTAKQAQYIIKELHEGICGYHSGARTMTTRILRPGYFWPIMEADCHTFIKKCIPLLETWQPHPSKTRTTSFYTIPVALRKVGNEHSRLFFPWKRPSKIPYSSRRLLHQVDRDQTISHNYRPIGPTIRLERYYMPIWRPTYDHHRQWPKIHRQRTR